MQIYSGAGGVIWSLLPEGSRSGEERKRRQEKFDWEFFPGVACGSAPQAPCCRRPIRGGRPPARRRADAPGVRTVRTRTAREDIQDTAQLSPDQLNSAQPRSAQLSLHTSARTSPSLLRSGAQVFFSRLFCDRSRSGITELCERRQDVGTFREWPPRRDLIRLWRYVGCSIELLYCCLFCWHIIKAREGLQLQAVLPFLFQRKTAVCSGTTGSNGSFLVEKFPYRIIQLF